MTPVTREPAPPANHLRLRSMRVRPALALLAVAVIAAAGTASSAAGRRFYTDDPLLREPESQDASGVAAWDIDLLVDLAINLFATPGDKARDVRAGNVNTIDEVPDSNWFTNRIGSRPVTVDQAVNGPLVNPGPAPGRWTVTAPKRSGFAPGFTMRDSTDALWFVSFDADGLSRSGERRGAWSRTRSSGRSATGRSRTI